MHCNILYNMKERSAIHLKATSWENAFRPVPEAWDTFQPSQVGVGVNPVPSQNIWSNRRVVVITTHLGRVACAGFGSTKLTSPPGL